MSKDLTVKILGDTKSLEAALGRSQKKTSSFGKALGVGAKAGAAGFLALGVAAKIGFDEFAQGQKVAAQTRAVIKSTGGAANVTAKDVDTLATALMNKSGVDDEAIKSGENMLLTFRNIQDQVGKNNDIFDQATKVTLDLSVAMGKDMSSASILVGKALNDPVKGLSALTRVGIQFTAAQENQIKALVKSGDTMKAQKIILAELNAEFGGSAEAAGKTLPGQLNILQESFKNLAGEIVADLLPSLTKVTGVVASATAWMRRNKTAAEILVGSIAALSAALVTAKVVYALANSSFIRFVRSIRVGTIAVRAFTAANIALDAVLSANPYVAVALLVIALGAAFVVAWKKSATFRRYVMRDLEGVQAAANAVGSAIMQIVGAVNALVSAVGRVPSLDTSLLDILRHASGTRSSPGGLAIVGEQGPELVAMPRGARVWNASQTAAMTSRPSSGGGGMGPQIIQVVMDSRVVAEALVRRDKVYQRQNGRGLFA